MVFGENRLWVARCRPPRKGHQPSASGSQASLRWESWYFFTFGRDAGRKTNILAVLEVLLKLGGSCGVNGRRLARKSLWHFLAENLLTAVYPVILPVTLGRFNPPHNLPVREC